MEFQEGGEGADRFGGKGGTWVSSSPSRHPFVTNRWAVLKTGTITRSSLLKSRRAAVSVCATRSCTLDPAACSSLLVGRGRERWREARAVGEGEWCGKGRKEETWASGQLSEKREAEWRHRSILAANTTRNLAIAIQYFRSIAIQYFRCPP